MTTLYDFSAPLLDGTPRDLADYRDKVALVVNVASRCGFTPQYAGLEKLWRSHRDQGLVILGFPCNQFGDQEPGNAGEIASFCSTTYEVSFPIFAKVDVNGDHADPIYEFLKSSAPGIFGSEAVKWNFTKFLVDRSGKVVDRFAPDQTPEAIEKNIERLL